MIIRFLSVFILIALSGCSMKCEKDYVYRYKETDKLFIETKNLIKRDYPEYFANVPENKVFGIRVYGETVECVGIYNNSGIIAERYPPLYCFDFRSREFVARL